MSHLITLFEQHSYLILFIGIFLELMALPISGEFLMSYAGYFVYQGKMNYILALLTVFLAGGAGITATYWIGRAGGYKLIEKYGRYIHLGPERYKKTAAWFERYGSKLLIFAYFIPGIRHFTGYISGISKMPFKKFIIPAYLGSFLWGICFITLGKVLGPRWEVFHHAASKYFVIFIIVLAVLLAGYLVYRYFKNQIKDFLIHFIQGLLSYLKTVRKTEIFLVFLTFVLIGMVTLMLGMAQDYLYGEFSQFNEITEYMVESSIYRKWMKVFLVFQFPYAFGAMIGITIIRIWRKGKDRVLEFLLLFVPILGARLFHESVLQLFSFLESIGFVGKIHSSNFPDLLSTLTIIIYGTCLFLLVRHSKNNFIHLFGSIFGVILLIEIAVANIASAEVLPSDIAGGYVYGGVWIFFNFLMFEMFRLVLERN
ncbi:DedA family protein [Neobacillus citreus]|uniref:DedA family protein n=1 Tax=Neobacillus citreus TaxID=2833578 RepID=A0A942T7S9_9BACI|nr:DedA family protein [Neobacillus citreus]MCH6268455.1 DedA family protein [Neobacillus citreus]